MNICVVVINIGNRPYLKFTRPFFESYCRRTNSDLRIIDKSYASVRAKLYFFLKGVKGTSRANPLAYYEKMLAIGRLLKEYDKVILLDDTCIVGKNTLDLSEVVSDDKIGAFEEGELGFNAFNIDKEFLQKKRGYSISKYYNSGVLIVSKRFQDKFSERRLLRELDLFAESRYPDQAFLAHIISHDSIPVEALPETYNYMHIMEYSKIANRKLVALPENHLLRKKRIFIHHITGYFEHRKAIIQQVCNYLNE